MSATALLVLLCVLAAFAGLMRWSYGSDTGRDTARETARPRPRRRGKTGDYGLLREIAIVPSHQAAQFVQDQLRRNGIRSTTAPAEDYGGQRVLVFPDDVEAATAALLRLHEGDPE